MMNTQTHKCTCGAEIGPRKPEDERCYFVQVFYSGEWTDCNMAPMSIEACKTLLSQYAKEYRAIRRIIRRTDEVVKEYGKGEE